MAKSLPIIALSVLALGLGGVSALFGLNHDTAIFFNAGLREWAGQTPYVDYYLPQGVVTGKVVAFAHWFFPNMGWTILALSALLNWGASLCVAFLANRATGSRPYGILAGVLTALCFTPVTGTFYNDHLAYLWLLVGFCLLVNAPKKLGSLFFVGALSAIAFHTKQPVGVMGLGVMFLTLLIRPAPRSRAIGALLLGHACVQLAFLGWLWSIDGLPSFFTYGVEYPLHFARRAKTWFGPMLALAVPWGIAPWHWHQPVPWGQVVFFAFSLAAYAAFIILGWQWSHRQRETPVFQALFLLTLSTLWCASLLGRLYSQLFFGIGGVIAILLFLWAEHFRGLALQRATVVFSLLAACATTVTALPPWQDSPQYQAQGDLKPLRVRKTGGIGETQSIVDFLEGRPGNYALFCTQCYLVPLELGRAPVSPQVYFEAGLTFPYYREQAIPRWESQIIQSLQRNDTRWIVVSTEWDLWKRKYPRLSQFFFTHYQTALVGRFHQILKPRSPRGLPQFGMHAQ